MRSSFWVRRAATRSRAVITCSVAASTVFATAHSRRMNRQQQAAVTTCQPTTLAVDAGSGYSDGATSATTNPAASTRHPAIVARHDAVASATATPLETATGSKSGTATVANASAV